MAPREQLVNHTRPKTPWSAAPESPAVLARLRPYLRIAVLVFFVGYFAWQFMTGDLGFLSADQRDQTLAAESAELTRVKAERHELETRARLLRDTSLSRDLLEERARSLLGLADPRDYVIRTGQSVPEAPSQPAS